MQYDIVGVERGIVDYSAWKYVLRNQNGKLVTMTKQQMADEIYKGGISVDRVLPIGNGNLTIATTAYENVLPLYCNNKKVAEGDVIAFGYTTRNNKVFIMCINMAYEILYIPFEVYERCLNRKDSSGIECRPISKWNLSDGKGSYYLPTDKVLKSLWGYNNGKFIGCKKDKRKDVVLLNTILGINDVVIGYRVLTPDLKIMNISQNQMIDHLFLNCCISDQLDGSMDLQYLDCDYSFKHFDIRTKINYYEINKPIPKIDYPYIESNGLNTDLKALYNYYNKKYFNCELPRNTEVFFNSRLRSAGGWCMDQDRTLCLSTDYISKYPEEVDNVMLHEMIHIRVHSHNESFSREMARIRDIGGDVTRYTKKRTRKYIVRCTGCGSEFRRSKLIPDSSYCSKCKCYDFIYKDAFNDTGWWTKEQIIAMR